MDELIAGALRGVDPGDPDAVWQIFRNLMALLPWWELFWFTLLCVVVGVAIAWYRGGSILRSIGWALLLGPFGWLLSWYQVPATRSCPRCGSEVSAARRRCAHCGYAVQGAAPRSSPK